MKSCLADLVGHLNPEQPEDKQPFIYNPKDDSTLQRLFGVCKDFIGCAEEYFAAPNSQVHIWEAFIFPSFPYTKEDVNNLEHLKPHVYGFVSHLPYHEVTSNFDAFIARIRARLP